VRPFAQTIALDDARRLIREAIAPLVRHETIALDAADGRVLADDVVAPMDQPPFERSAMDGYAVRAADVAGATRVAPTVLRLIGRAYTAEPFAGALAPGDCVEIATGAPVPDGADAVVMVEDTGRPGTPDWPAPAWLDSGEQVLVLAEARAGQHVIRRGSDMREGDIVLRAGQALDPSRVGALAAIGRADVSVIGKPIVAIFPTGNEVVRQGQPLPLASVYDVNSFTVAALVARHGGVPERHAPVPDTVEAVGIALDAAAGADVVVLGGGSSVGERDVVIDAVAARGEVLFHGIAVKPGKPTLFARIARSAPVGGTQLVFGMPGNPTSCLSNAHVLLMPALRRLAGLPPIDPPRVRRRLASAVTSPANRHQFLPVRIEGELAWPTFKGSGEITSLSQADGYVEIPIGVARLDEGTEVEVVGYE
jgi:molybdenum cofactor synthesis domain-containing protein